MFLSAMKLFGTVTRKQPTRLTESDLVNVFYTNLTGSSDFGLETDISS